MIAMPKAFPIEFRNDVVAVARKGEASIAQVARDFGIAESCLHGWLKLADIEDGVRPGVTAAESAELWALQCATGYWSRRTRSSVGRRRSSPASPSQNDLPAGPRVRRRRHPRRGDLPGARFLQAGFLSVARQPGERPGLGGCAPDQRRVRHP